MLAVTELFHGTLKWDFQLSHAFLIHPLAAIFTLTLSCSRAVDSDRTNVLPSCAPSSLTGHFSVPSHAKTFSRYQRWRRFFICFSIVENLRTLNRISAVWANFLGEFWLTFCLQYLCSFTAYLARSQWLPPLRDFPVLQSMNINDRLMIIKMNPSAAKHVACRRHKENIICPLIIYKNSKANIKHNESVSLNLRSHSR